MSVRPNPAIFGHTHNEPSNRDHSPFANSVTRRATPFLFDGYTLCWMTEIDSGQIRPNPAISFLAR